MSDTDNLLRQTALETLESSRKNQQGQARNMLSLADEIVLCVATPEQDVEAAWAALGIDWNKEKRRSALQDAIYHVSRILVHRELKNIGSDLYSAKAELLNLERAVEAIEDLGIAKAFAREFVMSSITSATPFCTKDLWWAVRNIENEMHREGIDTSLRESWEKYGLHPDQVDRIKNAPLHRMDENHNIYPTLEF